MARRLRVRLDLPAIATHLSKENEKMISIEEVVRWLQDANFVRQDETYWIVSEPDLGQVNPSEVLEVMPLEET
jgi:hypothetical protein